VIPKYIFSPCQRFSVILALVGILSACSSSVPKEWTSKQQLEQAVWADDNSELAVIELTFEEKASGLLATETQQRNIQHQIWLQNPDGSQKRALTQKRQHRNENLFYMKQAGYLVVDAISAEGIRRFDKIDLEGNELPIVEEQIVYQPCTEANDSAHQVAHQIIPSPDGSLMVEVYSPQCGQATIEFLHANNLSFIDGQTFAIDEPMTVMWHPYGYIIFTSNDLDKAWKVAPHSAPVPIQPPGCLAPLTTSSAVSLNGRLAYIEHDQVLIKPVETQQIFGCQAIQRQ